jgi:hypothetical protein
MGTHWTVTCTAVDCVLSRGVKCSDVSAAELLAFAHESRWREEIDDKHLCVVELVGGSSAAEPLPEPPVPKWFDQAGEKGGGHA